MPYIKQLVRDELADVLGKLDGALAAVPDVEIDGVLNYVVTSILARRVGRGGWRYRKIQQVVGVLECVKQEFYRRIGADREGQAIRKNGDLECYKEVMG